jgi:hypothetical protein
LGCIGDGLVSWLAKEVVSSRHPRVYALSTLQFIDACQPMCVESDVLFYVLMPTLSAIGVLAYHLLVEFGSASAC